MHNIGTSWWLEALKNYMYGHHWRSALYIQLQCVRQYTLMQSILHGQLCSKQSPYLCMVIEVYEDLIVNKSTIKDMFEIYNMCIRHIIKIILNSQFGIRY